MGPSFKEPSRERSDASGPAGHQAIEVEEPGRRRTRSPGRRRRAGPNGWRQRARLGVSSSAPRRTPAFASHGKRRENLWRATVGRRDRNLRGRWRAVQSISVVRIAFRSMFRLCSRREVRWTRSPAWPRTSPSAGYSSRPPSRLPLARPSSSASLFPANASRWCCPAQYGGRARAGWGSSLDFSARGKRMPSPRSNASTVCRRPAHGEALGGGLPRDVASVRPATLKRRRLFGVICPLPRTPRDRPASPRGFAARALRDLNDTSETICGF